MPQQYLTDNTTLFKDPDALDCEYLPDTIHYRDTQLRQLAETVRPALHGVRPVNTVLRGPPGTGKTTCARRIFTELEAAPGHITPVMINCRAVHSVYTVFHTIFTRIFGYKPPLTGVPLRRLTDPVADALTKTNGVLIVCLDDADFITRNHLLNSVLHSLLRMHESYPGVKTGVVITTNTPVIYLPTVLEPGVISVWQPEEVRFPRYGEEEIRHILQDRVRTALYPDVVPAEVLDHITTLTRAEGDLRIGISLLRRSVMNAERRGRTMVQEEDVQSALRAARAARIARIIPDLRPGEQHLLSYIAEMTGEETDGPVTASSLYTSYREHNPVSYSTFTHRLNRLADAKAVELIRQHTQGNVREVKPRYDPGIIRELCEG